MCMSLDCGLFHMYKITEVFARITVASFPFYAAVVMTFCCD